MNNKGQFSIIAALLVAVVLVVSVMSTYSAIRYGSVQETPQILSAIDETNLGLKEVLGFTVGYYGSVLKVTGNMTYAQQLSRNYLRSALNNIGDAQPEWGTVFELTNLTLNADWFSNNSYSQGSIEVNYNLTGLGIYGVSYATSTRLDVRIQNSVSTDKAELVILRDEDEPLINLGKNNLKFYRYNYDTSTWNLVEPANIASYANGTYVLDLPSSVTSDSYILQVEDTRGIMVLSSASTQLTSTLTWNSSPFREGFDYIDEANLDVIGTHGNFTAQQYGPDGIYDTLTEQITGTFAVDNYPSTLNPIGSTTIVYGSLADLRSDNGAYMQLRSHPAAYNTIGFDNYGSTTSSGSSMSWQHTTGSGNDRILLVSVDIARGASSTAPTTITAITYGGVSLTQVTSAVYTSTVNPQVRSYVYILVNPTSGTNTISVTFASSTYAVGGSVTYTNVNQATPIQASNSTTSYGSSQSVSLTASGTYSKVLFGHLGTYRATTYSISEDSGQTNRWSQTSQQYKGVGSDKAVTSGVVATSWSTSRSVSSVAIAVLLEPTPGSGTTYICDAEFSGSSNTETWNNIAWTIDSSATTDNVDIIYQLYNYRTGQYITSGDGYLTDILGTSDSIKTQTISTSLSDYRDALGNWKIMVNATKLSTQFDLRLDLVKYSINQTNYALNLEEQWLSVNASNVRQDLCIKTGDMDNEPLEVEIWHDGSWTNLMTLAPNWFNNVSLVPYIDSATLKIRFIGSNDETDSLLSSWNIDCVYIKDQPDISFLVNRQQSTITIEVLQNGTMRWLGQNMEVTTQTIPIPPVSVKAIHVNQTINGANQEVPFQIEDWASNYQNPLGITSNATVFSNRQMIVFLINSRVSDFTIWWDGSDDATQTPMAFTNRFFTNDNAAASTITNGNVTLFFSGGTVKSTIAGTGTYSTATFMRINQEASTYGAGCSYVIHHGIVRDIVMQEAEWSTGAINCPNVYANIIISLPANSTYYTYQLRLMFINSTQARTITDLCPIKLTPSVTSVQAQTENGTIAGFPVVVNGSATFSNYEAIGWTKHHFSQLIQDIDKGAGIMFRDTQNQKLYAFDAIAGTATGALYANTTSRIVELLPVDLAQVQFRYAYDITWQGAVATFDNTTPICSLYDGTTPTGLWILAEYPPLITVTAKN